MYRLLYLFLSLLFFACQPQKDIELLIQGGTIVDGTGQKRYIGDIAIKDDQILEVSDESIDPMRAKQLLDASGLIIAPGFIDLHTNIEVNIQDYPLAENFIRQGVTTVLASLHSGDQAYPLDTYADTLTIAPNIIFFAGHTWIREQVLALENRAPTSEEMDQMKTYVKEAMEQGALGLATGLEYVPGNFATEEEVIALAKVAADYGGVYFTHMRNEGKELLASIRESIAVGVHANIPVQINHLKAAGGDQWGLSEVALGMIDSARLAGVEITQDIYPYTAYSTYSSILIPQWAREGGREGLAKRLSNPVTAKRIKEEMEILFHQDGGGSDLTRVQFRNFEHNPAFSGKTMADYAAHLGLAPNLENGIDILLDLELKGGFIGIFHAMSDEDIVRFMQHPLTMFDSDGDLVVMGEGFPHPRCYGAFPRILGHYVRERGILTLEQAIQKMTSLPAAVIGQPQRGKIEPGNFADLVLFDFHTIADQSSYTDPHHFPSGIKHVMINGDWVIKEEEITNNLPGRWLRKSLK